MKHNYSEEMLCLIVLTWCLFRCWTEPRGVWHGDVEAVDSDEAVTQAGVPRRPA